MKLKEIADRLDCKLIGDGDIEIKGVAGIKEAEEGELTFVANPKYIKEIEQTKASAIILSHKLPETHIPTLRTSNPYYDFAKSLELFYSPPSFFSGIHNSVVISKTSTIGKNPSVRPYVVIGDSVTIGDNVVIHPHVVIYDNVTIGDNVLIHANSVIRENTVIGSNVIIQNGVIIGGDGFSFAKIEDGTHYKMVQLGKVVIEDDVEIQSNSAVDCSTVGNTLIKKGVKIDNLVQVAHGCSIGEKSIICGQVGLAGTTIVGNNVTLGGGVGTAGHLTIGDNSMVVGRSGVVNSIEKNSIVAGLPPIELSLWRKAVICFGKLPELFKKFRKLEKSVKELKKNNS